MVWCNLAVAGVLICCSVVILYSKVVVLGYSRMLWSDVAILCSSLTV